MFPENKFGPVMISVFLFGSLVSGAMKPVSSARNSVTDFISESLQTQISVSVPQEVVGKLGEIVEVIREGTQAVTFN